MVSVRISRNGRSYSKAWEILKGAEHAWGAVESAMRAAAGAWEAVEIEVVEVDEGNEDAHSIDGAEAVGASVRERD